MYTGVELEHESENPTFTTSRATNNRIKEMFTPTKTYDIGYYVQFMVNLYIRFFRRGMVLSIVNGHILT